MESFLEYIGGNGLVHLKKSNRRGKSMRESVSGSIKSGGREKIMQEVKVPSGLCRGAAWSCKGAPVFPQESTNQPTK